MLASFRRHLDGWIAKVFFALLVGVFVLWGVGDVVRNVGVDTSVAKVGGERIEVPEVQEAYRRQLEQLRRMFGGKIEPTPDMRKGIAGQALEQVITRTALLQAIDKMGIVVPEAALRQAIFDMPAFKGGDGKFDRATFDLVLRNNGLNEARFLGMMKADVAQRQLFDPVRAGGTVPEVMLREVFAFQQEKRVADSVMLKFADVSAPAAPDEAQAKRWYDNHVAQYSTPERRRIRVIVLAPDLLAPEQTASEEEIAQAYQARAAQYSRPERRTVQVLLANDEAEAKRLAGVWSGGADWAAMQKENGSAVEIPRATRELIGAPELADAAFKAPQGDVQVAKSALGWHVFRVTAIEAGQARTLADVRDELKAHIQADKAADLVFERSAKIEDMLAGGTPLEDLPGGMGLAAVAGTLDATGLTPEGAPAPIPGGEAMRQAIIQAAFGMAKNAPAHLQEGPRAADGGQGYFAVQVEDITPPAPKPFAEVAEQVTKDWTADVVRRTQETAAAAILAEVKAGKKLEEAALGHPVVRLPAAGRATGADGVPPQLIGPLFKLAPGEATMVETLDGFLVAVLAEVQGPDAAAEAAEIGNTRTQLQESLGNDMQALLTVALRKRATPTINTQVFNAISQTD